MAPASGGFPLSVESRAWYQGALGEIAVGQILATLPPGWVSFHALPIGANGADIDHLVVGPGGIFTINTKHHIGKNLWIAERTFMVNGHKVPYLRNAEYEANRVHALLLERTNLSLAVYPLIAVVGARRITIRSRPPNVHVFDARRLRSVLTSAPKAYETGTVAAIVAVLDDPGTWRTEPDIDPSGALAKFHELHATVRTARARNTLLAFGFEMIPLIAGGLAIWAVTAYISSR